MTSELNIIPNYIVFFYSAHNKIYPLWMFIIILLLHIIFNLFKQSKAFS